MKAALIPSMLKELRLPSMLATWEEFKARAIRDQWSHCAYLSALCEQELLSRETRRLQRRLRESRLPRGKSLESYEFARSSVNPCEIRALAEDASWVEQGRNLLLFGPSGVGKTHLVSAIGEELIHRDKRILFYRTTELCQHLESAKRSQGLPQFLEKLDKYDCLILDDFSYAKKSNYETQVLFELISERYERRSLILTSNLPFSDWSLIFEDKAMALAAIDRLVDRAIIIEIKGESYRRHRALSTGRPSLGPAQPPRRAAGPGPDGPNVVQNTQAQEDN